MPLLHQEVDGEAAPLRHLVTRALRLATEHALDRKEHKPVLGDRAPQLVERDAGFVELLEQLAAPVARAVVLEPLE